MSTTRRSVEGPERRLLPDRILDGSPDPNAQPPGLVRRAVARLDGGPPGRLAERLPAAMALRAAHSVARGLPIDPLADAGPGDPIDVMIPCHPKDLATARVAIASVRRHLRDVATGITVVMPDGADVPAWLRSDDVRVAHDGELLEGLVASGTEDRSAVTDGFRVQMLLKWAAPIGSMRPTLVLDADTVLLRARTWLVDGVQVLDCRAKHQVRFDRHTAAFLGGHGGRLPSFVTHHQLIQPDLLLDALGGASTGAPTPGLLSRWLRADTVGTPSEYQLYGAHAVTRHRHRVRPARWANTTFKVHVDGERILPPVDVAPATVEDYVTQLAAALPTSASATFHQRTSR